MENSLEQEAGDIQAKPTQLLLSAVPFEVPAAGNNVTVKIQHAGKNPCTGVSDSAFVSWEISDLNLPGQLYQWVLLRALPHELSSLFPYFLFIILIANHHNREVKRAP